MKVKIDTLKLTTAQPAKLIKDLFEKIDMNKITSFFYDPNELLYHKGPQYINHIYFKISIDHKKGLVLFDLYSDGNTFAESKAFLLLQRMLKAHFADVSEIL